MIIRKKKLSLQATYVTRTLLSVTIIAGVAGCGSIGSMFEPDRIDYKSASKAPTKTLEVPPNLTQLQRDNRYANQENNRGIATATGYSMQQTNAPSSSANTQVIAPAKATDMHLERAGNQRWLVIKQSPEALWPQIKDFWQDSGFLVSIELPEAGVMETDWAEKRLNVPQGTVRSWLSKALDSAYDSGIRDKFRTRLERAPDGSTEIYISHRGAEEKLIGAANVQSGAQTTTWVSRPSDPELEVQMLSQLMTRLGAEEVKAKAIVANVSPIQQRSKLIKGENGSYVEAGESFDRAWRRVGLALDRVGFTVEDRDRSQGLYFVRYVDQDKDAQDKAEKGFMSKLFSFGSSDDPKSAQRYRISVKEEAGNSRIQVLNGEGRPDTSATAGKILALLNEQLK
jgi:outer membrane protein assembly factor BamC